MTDHRIRLKDEDVELICATLRARLAMARGKRKAHITQLLERLEEGAPGNPNFRSSSEARDRR